MFAMVQALEGVGGLTNPTRKSGAESSNRLPGKVGRQSPPDDRGGDVSQTPRCAVVLASRVAARFAVAAAPALPSGHRRGGRFVVPKALDVDAVGQNDPRRAERHGLQFVTTASKYGFTSRRAELDVCHWHNTTSTPGERSSFHAPRRVNVE